MPVTYSMDYMAYVLLTKCEVKIQVLSFCTFKDWDKIKVHKDAQEVWGWDPAILTNQVWLEVFFAAQDQSGQS